jgi:proline iminopeptidase
VAVQSRTDDPAPITWHTHVEDLDAISRELGLATREIVGYSWGGLLAMLYALTSADAVPDSILPSPGYGRFPPARAKRAPVDSGFPGPDRSCSDHSRAIASSSRTEFARRQQGPVIQALRTELAASGLRERDRTPIGSDRSSSALPDIFPTRRARTT